MDINYIIGNIEELFEESSINIEDIREYYYMLRSTLDSSFEKAINKEKNNNNSNSMES